ncbi:alpha/beta fold hydrolase [Fluviibacterium sp. DFM31]|uniref:Alpha/beta fold hydrolase n=1 Tax=Meridianimarinicoccus marinus TaxID=3231483 RepID=A0ABV3L6F4_9RHOB
MFRVILAAGLLIAAEPGFAQAQDACQPSPCLVDGGQYRVALPAIPATEPTPTVLYLHGYAASSAAVLRNSGLLQPFLDRGYAVVVPDGQVDTLQGHHLDWGVRDGFGLPRDDIAFVRQVLADAATRFSLDPENIVLMGYSRGGSMVWDIACHAPDTARAYVSHAGGFWAPLPPQCAASVRLLHSHGFTDRTLPVEGTGMEWFGYSFEVASVFDGLEVWQRTMGCPPKADTAEVTAAAWTKAWTGCAEGGQLTLQLLPGGHGRRAGWAEAVLDWLEPAPDNP